MAAGGKGRFRLLFPWAACASRRRLAWKPLSGASNVTRMTPGLKGTTSRRAREWVRSLMVSACLRLVAPSDTTFNEVLDLAFYPSHRSGAESDRPREPAISHEQVQRRIRETSTSQNFMLVHECVLELFDHAGTPSGVVEHGWIPSRRGGSLDILPSF